MKAFCKFCKDVIDPEFVDLIAKLAEQDQKFQPLPNGWCCGKCTKKKYPNLKLRS